MPNKVQFLTSNVLRKTGVRHGWCMRYGGVSTGLFESLNGKKGSGDSDVHVDENRSRAINAVTLGQLGNQNAAHIVHAFESNIIEAEASGEYKGYDASIATKSNIVLSQTTADCGTVIIADTTGGVVAVIHGSWHTLKAKIICDTVAKMKQHTTHELVAGIGPMICKNCYEFGLEASDIFEPKYLTDTSNKFLVDLKAMIYDQLIESGVTQIDDTNVCTFEDNRFFSHRRTGAKSGRFLTLAAVALHK